MRRFNLFKRRLLFYLFLGIWMAGFVPLLKAQKVVTLENALEIAMKNSPDIRHSKLNLERSRRSLQAQQAAQKSQFSLSLNPIQYRRDRSFNTFFSTWNTAETKESYGTFTVAQPIPWTDGTFSLINQFSYNDNFSEYQDIRSKTYSNNLYISFEQPIFTYNRRKLELRTLELDLENASYSYSIQRLALERLVTQNFYDVFQNKMSLEIANEELENQKQGYQIIKNKVDAGISAQEELYQAELNLSSSKLQVQNQEVALANALDQFKQLIGISLFDEITITADISHQRVDVDLQKAIDHGIKNRMEIRQREIDIENAQSDLTRTASQNEFKGNISLVYGIIGENNKYVNVYDKPTKNQSVSVSFEIPLWDWGEKESRIKASEAVVKTRELSLDDEKNNIIISIRQAYRELQNLVSQIEIARQNVRNAQSTYDINLERYKNGDLTSMDLNLFQNQLSQKKMDLVSSLINYKLALLNLKIQSLWDFKTNRSVLSEIGYDE